MLGAAEEWFYRRLGGLDVDLSRERVEERITVRPVALPGIDWVKTAFNSKVGLIQSDWKRNGRNVDYTITVPGGVEATVVLAGKAVAAHLELHALAGEASGTTFRVGPGVWVFHAQE